MCCNAIKCWGIIFFIGAFFPFPALYSAEINCWRYEEDPEDPGVPLTTSCLESYPNRVEEKTCHDDGWCVETWPGEFICGVGEDQLEKQWFWDTEDEPLYPSVVEFNGQYELFWYPIVGEEWWICSIKNQCDATCVVVDNVPHCVANWDTVDYDVAIIDYELDEDDCIAR